MEDNIIKLIDEQGEEIELELVDSIEIKGITYLLLADLEDEEDAYVYKVVEKDGKEEYVAVEDEEEFEMVQAEYDLLFDDEE